MNKHVVLCWELGGALGHVAGFRKLIQSFLSKNNRVSIIVRNLVSAKNVLGDLDITMYQSPIFMTEDKSRLIATYCYSDIIYDLGYGGDTSLKALINGWISLFRVITPDLVICDHSPTAILAAKCIDLPSATFGMGFFVPPPSKKPVLFKNVDKAVSEEIDGRHAIVVDNINGILQSFGKKTLEFVSDLFIESHHFLCTFSELDHYIRNERIEYMGPRFSIDMGQKVILEPNDNYIFVYLKPNTNHLDGVIETIGKLGHRAIIFIPNASQETHSAVKKYNKLKLYVNPIMVSSILNNTNMVITNAGHGLVSVSLLNNKRVMLIPNQLEQNILTRKLTQQKLCTALQKNKHQDIEAVMSFTLQSPILKENIAKFSAKYKNFDQDNMLTSITQKSIELAN